MTLRVTFLGTSGAVPTAGRNPSSVHVNREGEEFLFDVAEGTQRQMMRFGTGFSISAIFLTHVHGDHVLGLPGLCQTMAFNERTAPLSITTPAGTGGRVRTLLTAIDDGPSFRVDIHEVRAGETAFSGEGYDVRTFETDHRTRSVGYALVEDDRKGRFDRERAEELGVPEGPLFSRLHEGETVELEDGTLVEPGEIVGPPRPGRRLVYTGDTRPAETVVEAARDADLLIHDATFVEEAATRARETGHATAREAAEVAERAGAKRLALTHVSSRYAGNVSALATEAVDVFEGAFVAEDGQRIDVPYPE
ncbi:ribonuclease Z [Natronorarus salvus]|uniref:ribonuclease Z n=1 Tax=Natronorarus salvus TaxID=3117733 RepID=UPI002F268B81